MTLPANTTTTSPVVDSLPMLPQVPSLHNTYGAVLIGTYVSLMLYGMTLHQAYRYSRLSTSDSSATKYYVAGLLVLDTFHTILCMHMCYWYLVENYFDPLRLYTGVWSINVLSVVVGVTIICCQCFYARRVYLLGRRYRYLVLATIIMFLAELGCAIGEHFAASAMYCVSLADPASHTVASAVQAFVLPDFGQFRKVTWLVSAGFGIAVIADALLTGVLILTLNRSRTGFRRTDSMIDILILYAMCTGLATDLFSLLSFLFALILPNEMIYVGCDSVAAKLYVNSVLAAQVKLPTVIHLWRRQRCAGRRSRLVQTAAHRRGIPRTRTECVWTDIPQQHGFKCVRAPAAEREAGRACFSDGCLEHRAASSGLVAE
ncbi:hypothetical protein GY45DRAFT_1364146 [Cubamyces sp. BRFM 1775]|nr:hypothetical protein GY45DRAFT_1364146 [Cubamyces sp. BRFM 1775]